MRYINYRDTADKTRLIEKLAKLYANSYDLRLCQVISNLHGLGQQDIFFTYDDQLEEMLDKELKALEERNK